MYYLSFLAGLPHYNTITVAITANNDTAIVRVEQASSLISESPSLYSHLITDFSGWMKADMSTVFVGMREAWDKKRYDYGLSANPHYLHVHQWYNPYHFAEGNSREL
jgi:hypothetical protein